MKLVKFHLSKTDIFLVTTFFAFSCLLMLKTLTISPGGDIMIASKAWSDFAATVPLIRSFSFGSNFPPEYPIFAGPPIRYHFGFFLLVGILEKIGLPLNMALNIPSILGFTLLLTVIYFFAKRIFNSTATGVVAVVFFLFNGSFSFLEFFKLHPLSAKTFSDIVTNTSFPSFGPYDGKTVSAFWNLNIYTNQRHLAQAYAFFLVLLFFYWKYSNKNAGFTYKKAIAIGILMGILPFIHYAVFGMVGIMSAIVFLIYPKIRMKVFLAGTIAIIMAIPQILYMGSSALHIEPIKLGYLVQDLSVKTFFGYWLLNLGLILPFSILGFLTADKKQRLILIPFLTLFVVGNLFQVSPEIAANHKFFNLFLIGINMFAAYFIVKIFQKNIIGTIFTVLIFPLLILSGVIDLFPIFKDYYVTLQDIPNNETALFIRESTPKHAVILNGSYLYDPASIAGRKIYLGWPYFSWSAGYDTDGRFKKMKQILESTSKETACHELLVENINYVELQSPSPIEGIEVNYTLFEDNFERIYSNIDPKIDLYSVGDSCSNGFRPES